MGARLATFLLSIAAAVVWAPAARAADKAGCLRAYEAAQQDKNSGKLRTSRKELLVCVEPECPALLRADCSSWLAEVERGMPTVVVSVSSGGKELSDVRVLVDDEVLATSLTGAALEVDPGQRVFRVEAPGRPPVTQTFTIRQGEKNRRVELELSAEAGAPTQASSPPVISYVLAGVGAVGLLSFSYFGVKGLSGRSDLKACKGECAPDDVDAVRADFTRADVSLAIAALAFGGAAYFYFTERSDEPREGAPASRRPGARLGIWPHPNGVRTALEFAF